MINNCLTFLKSVGFYELKQNVGIQSRMLEREAPNSKQRSILRRGY
jgi:hypothetical protein